MRRHSVSTEDGQMKGWVTKDSGKYYASTVDPSRDSYDYGKEYPSFEEAEDAVLKGLDDDSGESDPLDSE